MKLWEWFAHEQNKIMNSGSAMQHKMLNHYHQGNRLMRLQHTENAYVEYTEGLQVAEQLKDLCWELFFRYWQLETRAYYEANIKVGLDLAIRASTLAHKSAYQDCAIRPTIFLTLAEIYSFMDPVGYKTEIDELNHYVLTETPPDKDGEQRILYMQACIAFEHDDIETAESIIAEYMNRLGYNPFRETFYHTLMCRISFARGDIPRAYQFAEKGAFCARISSLANPEGWNRMWMAALAQRLGNEQQAQQLYALGIVHYQTHASPQSYEYYDAACDYHEQRGEIEKAVDLREEQIPTQAKLGSVQFQCHAALQTARLLGRLGRDIQPAIAQARQFALDLQKPALYLAKVQQVEAGNFHEYAWQK
jgi:hypothetical protein